MKFKLKLTVSMKVLLVISVILSAFGTAYNTYNVIVFSSADSSAVKYYLVGALSLLLFVFSVSTLFFSRYSFKGETLACRFGFFLSKLDLSTVTGVFIDLKNEKIALSFKGDTYTYILLDKKYFDEFSSAVKKANGNVIVNQKND